MNSNTARPCGPPPPLPSSPPPGSCTLAAAHAAAQVQLIDEELFDAKVYVAPRLTGAVLAALPAPVHTRLARAYLRAPQAPPALFAAKATLRPADLVPGDALDLLGAHLAAMDMELKDWLPGYDEAAKAPTA